MKKTLERALQAKQAQRAKNASRTVAEKLRVVDRLHQTSRKLKNAKPVGAGRRPQGG
jgi:hypothetical protein